MSLGDQFQSDRSVVPLLLSNLLTIIWAIVEGWRIVDVMLIYWVQSVVIGYYNYHRIMDLEKFSTRNFKVNNRRPDPTPETKKSVARFFALHYGIFHAAYLAFILGKDSGDIGVSSIGIIACAVAFIFNHRYSYQHNKERDSQRVPNIGTIMFFPYARIVPMHLTIGLAASYGNQSIKGLFLFLVLKTVADVIMHMIEHADARRKKPGWSKS
jgi:Na+/H+ antiporter NhaD/arsenite permease-like protein